MNRFSIHRLDGLFSMMLVIALMIPFAAVTQAADNSFVLNNPGFGGTPGTKSPHGNYEQTFAGVEITAKPDPATGMYRLDSVSGPVPLSWDWYTDEVATGTGTFSMRGTYDPKANAVTGTFTMEQEATATINTSFSGKQPLSFAMTWKGDVTGSVTDNVAMLSFSGTITEKCMIGTDYDCAGNGTQMQMVWFDVSNASYADVPGASRDPDATAVLVSAATGDTYYSPADQADLEPAARTWQLIKPGDRLILGKGVMLRTGKNGSLRVMFDRGALIHLRPSTMLGVQDLCCEQTPQSEVYMRLFQGIADFYMRQWKESNKKFEVETDMANGSIQGTTFQVAVTDTVTVVTVSEGVVAVTDKATGTTIDVGASERATVDAAGMTKAAAPDAAALLDENATPGASALPDASAVAGASPPADGAATPAAGLAAVSSADAAAASPAPATPSGSDTGGSSLPIVLGVVAAVVVVVVVAGLVVARRRATPAGPSGPSSGT
ncbi:MAG: FecR domain-containing protein [Chloroflexota bacterium]